jgi:hypothetical protein
VAEWARIKSSKKTDDWVSYLRSFPNGRFAEIAQMRLTRLLAEDEQRAAEKRQAEEQQRLERERIRLAEEQRLAAERKQLEEQQLQEQRRREEEQQRVELSRQQKQERLERERQRFAEAERLAAERQRLETDRRRIEQVKLALARPEQVAAVKPAPVQAASAAPTPSTPAPSPGRSPDPNPAAAAATPRRALMIDIREGVAVPTLIAPSANPFSAGRYPVARIYTVGDSATIRQTDLLTGIEENTRTAHVTRVDYDEDRVEFNQGAIITDLMGNALKQGPNEYDTPVQFTPAEFQVGKKWTAAFHRVRNSKSDNVSFDMHIVKRETITVPAGAFDTFRIEGEGWNLTRGWRRGVKFWMIPGLNFAVRSESVTHDRNGRFTETIRRELVALHQQAFSL